MSFQSILTGQSKDIIANLKHYTVVFYDTGAESILDGHITLY